MTDDNDKGGEGRRTRGRPDPVDDLVFTRHTLTHVMGELSYTARTGRVVLRRRRSRRTSFQGLKARAEYR